MGIKTAVFFGAMAGGIIATGATLEGAPPLLRAAYGAAAGVAAVLALRGLKRE